MSPGNSGNILPCTGLVTSYRYGPFVTASRVCWILPFNEERPSWMGMGWCYRENLARFLDSMAEGFFLWIFETCDGGSTESTFALAFVVVAYDLATRFPSGLFFFFG